MIDFSNVTEDMRAQGYQNIGNLSGLEDLETFTMQTACQILQYWLENYEEIDPEPRTRCRNCGQYANHISKRVGFVRTQFGLIRYRRAYYVCPHCHQSTCPLDERLNPIESLARLRSKVASGKSLPVAELAQSWGLGSLNIFSSTPPTPGKGCSPDIHLGGADNKVVLVNPSSQSILVEAG